MNLDFGFSILDFNLESKIENPKSAKKAINILVGNFGEERILVEPVVGRISRRLIQNSRDLKTSAFRSNLNQTQSRAFVKDNHEQAAADDANKNTFAFAFVDDRRKDVLADQLGHAAR